MTPLPEVFLTTPLAHRALHDRSRGIVENSLRAVEAAIDAGYGIEIDLQLSSDGAAIVFHDYALDRLTEKRGPIQQQTRAELEATDLKGSSDRIPSLDAVLRKIDGAVPLVIEIKDQDGALGQNVGRIERAVATDLQGYDGPVAVMSFNPHSVSEFAALRPDLPVGLVTDFFHRDGWPGVPDARLRELRDIPDFERLGVSFISHDVDDLDTVPVSRARDAGATVLCWTVRSLEVEITARKIAHNITFEGYLPAIPPP